VSSTRVHSVNFSIEITTCTNQSDIDSHWLPSAAALTKMDPNEPEPLMKLPISIENDPSRYDTTVIIDSARTLNFASQKCLVHNVLMGKCTYGPQIVVRIENE